jgi:hypothetical protein
MFGVSQNHLSPSRGRSVQSVLQFASVHSVEFIKMVELAVTVRVPHVCLEMAVADDVGAVKGHWMVSALSCRILINIDSQLLHGLKSLIISEGKASRRVACASIDSRVATKQV